MELDIKDHVIIIALRNLIETYNTALEDKNNTLNEDDITIANLMKDIALDILQEYVEKSQEIRKPKWEDLP